MSVAKRHPPANLGSDGPTQYYAGHTSGEAYFTWQKTGGQKTASYNSRFFAPFIRENDAVLDFGCGGGYLLQALSCRTRTGVDINPAAREHAQSLGIEVFSHPAELEDRKFDAIISSHCLEHVPSPYEALAQLRKLLDKDGKIVLLLPVNDWRNEPWTGPDINFHLYAWTPKLLGNLLIAAGFEPVFIKILNYANPPSFDQYLWDFSERVFGVLSYFFSIILRRRQIWAVARPRC
jgi:SAM-dependent methyltransferase